MSSTPIGGLRSRLLLLVLLAVLPGLLLTLYSNIEQRPLRRLMAEGSALRLALFGSRVQEHLIEGTHVLLVTLAHLPEVQGSDTSRCNTFLDVLRRQSPFYANLGVIDAGGALTCSAIPFSEPVNLSDRDYFQSALHLRRLAVGGYQLGRVTERMTVNLGYPVLDETGQVRAVVFAALDLAWLSQLTVDAGLPPGSTLSIVDQSGTILAHYPDSDSWVGEQLPDTALLETVLAQAEGTTIAGGLDGRRMLYGFTSLAGVPENAYVLVGIPEAAIYAEPNRILARNLALLGLMTVIALSAAWFGADLFILRQVKPLLEATKQLAAGDLSARTGARNGPAELVQVASAFDAMATILEQRTAQLRETEARYRTLVEQIPAIVYTADFGASATWHYVSPQIEALLGFTPAEWMADPDLWFRQLHEDDRERYLSEEARSQATGQPLKVEYRVLARDGRVVWFHDEAVVIRDDDGRPLCLQGVMLDITERKRAEEAVREVNNQLTRWVNELERRNREISLLNSMGDLLQTCATAEEAYAVVAQMAGQLFPTESGALFVLGPSRHLVEAVAVWGERPPAAELFLPNECWALRRGQVHFVQAGHPGLLCRHLKKELPGASDRALSSLCLPLVAQSEALGVLHLRWDQEVAPAGAETPGDPAGLSGARRQLAATVAEHVSLALANLRLQETLRNQSIRDPVTGLFNRRYMEEMLEREVRRAARSLHPMGVIMCDLDHFKRFNDTFGHDAGDALLREFGNFLQATFRAEDIVCRYGGEEFVLILPESNTDDTRRRAEHLREAVKRLRVSYRSQFLGPVSLSLGVATFPDHGATGEALLRAADAALYRAKVGGRDRVSVAE